MSEIRRLDFVGVPSQDADRARAFYRDTLGLRPDEHAESSAGPAARTATT
jgi:catechol 2,3-dioxygenase-like lactoylglutathione lyase family enzyme